MPNPSRCGVCLDTSFLITLCGTGRAHHATAQQYFEYWLKNRIPLFLPSVCYAEFLAVDDNLPGYILQRVHLMSFDTESAVLAGAIQRRRLSVVVQDTPRDALKDDIKIIANAAHNNLLGIVTDDENSMARYVRRAAETMSGVNGLKVLTLSAGFDEGSATFSDPQLPLPYPSQTP